MTKEIKKINYYKISTFILIGIILLLGTIYLLDWYGNSQFNKGYHKGGQTVFNGLITNIETQGYVSFGENNNTYTLISAELLQIQKEQTILEIITQVEKEGYVQLYNNDTNLILVPYQE